MLHKSKSKKRNLYKYVLVLPLLLLFVLVFNVETKARPIPVNADYSYTDAMFLDGDQQYHITKESTDDDISSLTEEIKNRGGSLAVKKVKRNENGHITSIKVSFKMSGSEVSGQYSNNDGIPPITFGEGENGGLFINGSDGEVLGHNIIHVESVADGEQEHDGDYEVIVKKSGKHKAKGHQNVWVSSDSGDHREIVIEEVNGKKTITIDGKEVTEDELKKMSKSGKHHKSNIRISTSSDEDGEVMIYMNDDDNDHDIEVISGNKNGFFFIDTDDSEKPLFMIDGKEATEKEVKALSPEQISTINVVKDKKAEEKYGDMGKNGVVIITTKKED